ncbi:MAG: chromosome segregation protein SMC [Actinomycetota bacterium]|nr:chromosome segregation protein SMC [Actinomycetota bacterium]
MYLRSLNARGFKSFADKVTLDFKAGISVIVGPNGSGKSNVADAVLWVLGEQSPRNLRGTKMEDVIFAGSATRQPLSMGEVSLSFDNRNGEIPIDFPEVVVTRRIYRTGESEYLLNKTACRLVDIQELLSDLGVGRELTAVIGQNKLEAILRSRSEDRRAFLEEVAGLRKHRRRKEKALRKLEGMDRNLVRVKDIISEVRKQLRPLERQAGQAREYQELAAEAKELSVRILVAEMKELKEQWENRQEEEVRFERELKEVTSGIREGKERLTKLGESVRELRRTLEECRLHEMRLLSLGERLRACEGLGEERLKLYAALSGEIGFGKSGWLSRREDIARKRGKLEEERNRALEDQALIEEKEGDLRLRLGVIEEMLGRARRERDKLRRFRDEERNRLERSWESLAFACRTADEHREKARGVAEEGEEIEARLRDISDEKRKISGEMKEIEAGRAEAEEKIAAAGEDLRRFKERMEAIWRKQRRSQQEEALVVARLQALQEVFSSRIDYASAAAGILEKGEDLPGIMGMLLHHVKISEDWERALESYLGPWLFCIVTSGFDDAMAAIRVLKDEEGGYGLFLPTFDMAREGIEDMGNMARIAGGVPALKAVEGDEVIRPALEFLLSDVVLCRSLEEAEGKAELYPKLTFVTAEGDVIAPRGVVKGGARPRSPFHVIARRREIEQLQEMLDLCDEESMSLEIQRKSALTTIDGLERDMARMVEDDKGLEVRFRELELSHKEMELREKALKEELEEVERLAGVLEGEELEARDGIIRLNADFYSAQGAIEGCTPRLGEGEQLVVELREAQRHIDESLQEIKAEAISLAERRHHLEERLRELEEDEAGQAPPSRKDLAVKSRVQEDILSLVKRLEKVHGDLASQAETSEKKGREELAANEGEIEALRHRIEELEVREQELREVAHNSDLAAAQLKMRVDMLVQRLLDEYRIPMNTALTEYLPTAPAEEMGGRLRDLESRIESMGQVNLRAVEEHKALKERHDFLMEQVGDLKESKSSLLKVIRAIDREIVRIFKDTYEEVGRHFQELFEKLFPQGRAELSLSDPTDLLNTGVDIEAQPRGKRLKKLSLLSGGETALTSLAFLFALFKTRPSPFYFLDEVEAALDDVNLHRFLSMLIDFKGDSQLIIITHQKRTMEIADVLYGVSMQASGVSRIISQRLDEAEQLARTGTA